MLTLEERFMIKEMYRKGVSISEIARRTGRDRKTIRQLVTAPLVPSPKARKLRPRKIDPYVPYLENRLSDGVLNVDVKRDYLWYPNNRLREQGAIRLCKRLTGPVAL